MLAKYDFLLHSGLSALKILGKCLGAGRTQTKKTIDLFRRCAPNNGHIPYRIEIPSVAI